MEQPVMLPVGLGVLDVDAAASRPITLQSLPMERVNRAGKSPVRTVSRSTAKFGKPTEGTWALAI